MPIKMPVLYLIYPMKFIIKFVYKLDNQICVENNIVIKMFNKLTSDLNAFLLYLFSKLCYDCIGNILAIIGWNMPNNPANKGTFVLRLRFIKRCCYCSGNILDNILSNQMCHNPANKSAFALNFKHIQLCCDCIGQAVANVLSNQECQTIRQIRVHLSWPWGSSGDVVTALEIHWPTYSQIKCAK